jgi:hypothetical protein
MTENCKLKLEYIINWLSIGIDLIGYNEMDIYKLN